MGVAERKVREKQRRLNDILDAAEEVFFAADGITASMDDVAKRAEVSKGTLYIYFQNKESLYLGIGARANVIVQEMFASAAATEKTGINQTLAITEAYYEFSKRYPNYYKIKSLSDGATDKAFQALSDDPLGKQCQDSATACGRVLREAIALGVSDGSIRSDIDPDVTTVLLWAKSNGVISLIQIKGCFLKEKMNINVESIWNEFQKTIRISLELPKNQS